ncbi:hypothetical protein [Rossellomorea vietnamensis]|uniref:Uncharacterized protein n=1 Tax=Rossellomorea vietnamensis TaxID=218284 RepID=A0ACD4C857_9BACI|nr:hypothetical protein [Rossellomorea vietnamensis]UXH44864.1 hypothetical protein N5C46_02000 [Rossellomorea vietnamensis]WQI96222.1 hypothetical protein Q7C14_02110 [Rossellomorea vietnamensis]
MKKGLIRIGMIFSILLLFYMSTHRPNEEQFYSWLLNEYDIECHASITCTKKMEGNSYTTLIETGSNIKNGYLLFNTIGKIYEDENGSRTTVKAIGIFGKYFTIMIDEQG